MKDSRVRFAIIGCGVIAFTHATALERLPECELYAVCDIIPEKAETFAAKHGAKKVYTDYREALDDPEVDIACVCVPSGIHGDVCIAAAERGKAIVCEKPMEIRPERIAEVIAAVEKAGVMMQCIFQRRLMPAAMATRRAVKEGKLGKICFAEAKLLYYRDQPYYNSAGWRGTWELDGGGALMNQGVHGIDLILWMLGDEIASVYGHADTLARDIKVEDTAAAVLKMKKSALCVIEGATTAYPGFSSAFTIVGEKGTISFNDEDIIAWDFIDPASAPEKPELGDEKVGGSKNHFDIGISGHVLLLSDAARALRENRAPLIPPREATLAVQVICDIYKSSRENRVIVYN